MCILLVEDELLIRLMLTEELEAEGFEVCVAEDGDRAEELIEDRTGPAFTLLVTDIHMPGRLNGLEVARLMHERHPTVPVIYTTGRPDAINGARLGAGEVLVEKPFTPSELLAEVHRLLPNQRRGG